MRTKNIPVLTYTLIVINVIIFLIETAFGGSDSSEVAIKFGAQTTPLVLEQGEWFRLFTAMFLHFGFEHLFGNMVALFAIGTYVEEYFGKLKFVIIYITSGLAGNLFTLLIEKNTGANTVSAGASGAVFGIVSCILIFALDRRTRAYFPINRAIVGIALMFIPGILDKSINFYAHIGGFLMGLLLSYTFYYFKKNKNHI